MALFKIVITSTFLSLSRFLPGFFTLSTTRKKPQKNKSNVVKSIPQKSVSPLGDLAFCRKLSIQTTLFRCVFLDIQTLRIIFTTKYRYCGIFYLALQKVSWENAQKNLPPLSPFSPKLPLLYIDFRPKRAIIYLATAVRSFPSSHSQSPQLSFGLSFL